MENKTKRFLKVALVLMLVVAMLPQITIGAKAADTADTVTAYCEHESHNQNGICAIEGCGVAVGHTYDRATGLCACGAKEPPKSDAIAAYTSATTIWGETWGNARKSYAIKVLDASGNVMGTTTLNTKLDVSMDGDVKVSWHITLPGNADADEYWIQEWVKKPTLGNMPAKVELWIDGVKTSESAIQLNGPDGINKIVAAVADADGKIITSYATTFAAALDAAQSGDTIELLADVTENAVITQNISINTGAFKVNGTVKVTNGATLTVAEGETLTVSDYLLVGNDNYFANLENAGNGGKLVVNGTVDAQQVNADNGGEIAVNGIMRVINTVAVENGEMENAVPGKLTVSENGKIETKFLNVFAGATVTVDGAVELLEHETDQQQLRAFGGATVTVNGSLSSDRSASVDTGSTLNVNGGELTVGGTLTNNGTVTVSGESTLNVATLSGTKLKLLHGAIIKDSTVGGKATLYGKVIFRGDNTFTMIDDYGNAYSEEYAEWIVEKGAALTLTEMARYGLGYGDKATIYGEIEDALTARENLTEDDISVFMHGLVAMSNWDVENSLTVKDSYVTIGSNNSFGNSPKTSHVGTFNILFENAVLDASRITFYEAPSKTNFDFVNSDVKIGTFMTRDPDSEFTLTNTKLLSTATTNGPDEGNYNAGKLTLVNSSLTYNAPVTNTGKINLDATSCLAAPSITGTGTITIDATGLTGKAVKVIDLNGGEAPEVSVTNGEGVTVVTCADGDVILSNADMSAIYVDSAYTGEIGKEVAKGLYMGINAFDNINDAAAAAEKAATKLVINSASKYTTHQYYFLNTVIDAENERFDYVADASVTYDVDANAPFTAYQILINNAELNVPVTGNLRSSEALRIMGGKIAVQGNRAENAEAPTNIFTGSWGGGVTATDDTQVSAGYLQLNQKTAATFADTVILVTAGIFTVDDAAVVLDNAYLYIGNCGTYTPAVLTVDNGGKLALTNNASIVKNNSFNANMTVGADAKLSLDISSKLVIDTLTVAEGGTVIIDATGIEEDKTIKVIDLNGTESLEGKVTFVGDVVATYGADGDVTIEKAVAKVGETNYTSLEAAIAAAKDGDTVTVITDLELTTSHNVPAGVTVTSAEGVKITTATHHTFVLNDGSVLKGLTVVQPTVTGAVNTVYMNSGSKVEGCSFSGQYGIDGNDTTCRAIEVAPGAANIVITGNTFQNLCQPAYVNNGVTGEITNNYADGTKGWVICSDSNVEKITGNTFGTNAVDICIIASGNVDNYSGKVVALSKDNDNATVENQVQKLNAENGALVAKDSQTLKDAINAAADGDTILLTADVDYGGTATLVIDKAITLNLGGHTLTTHGTYGGLQLKNGCSLKNGTLAHKGTVTAIKAWNVAAIEDVVIDVAFKAEGKTIGGIVIQEGTNVRINTIKNVTIQGEGLTNGIQTYNCGNATDDVIGSMKNVTIDAKGTGMLISAPCGTATNCSINGDKSGIEIWIKGTYSAKLDLVDCDVNGGEQAVFAHDEFNANPDIVNNGKLEFTVDEDTEFASESGAPLTLTITNTNAENVTVDEKVAEATVVRAGDTYYTSMKAALDAAANGATITLLEDVDLGETAYELTKSIVLNLNGKKLTGEIKLAEGVTLTADKALMEQVKTAENDYVVHENGVYSVADAALNAANMTLGDSFSLNFWVKSEDLRDANRANYKAVMTAPGKNPVEITGDQWIPVEWDGVNYFQIPFAGLAAKEMNVEVEFQIFNGDKAESGKFTESLRKNAEDLIKNEALDAKLRTALVDMLNYGAAAQVEFKVGGELANAGLTAEQQALATKSYDLPNAWANADGIGYGSNLELKNEIILHIWYKAAGVKTVKIDGVEVGPEKITPRIGTSIMSVAVTDLAVADGFNTVTVEFVDENGKSTFVEESVASYLKYMLSKSTDPNGLYDATAKFITSAKAYFKSANG